MATQKCKWCGKSKTVDKNYGKNKFTNTGYSTVCNKCRNSIKDLDGLILFLSDNNIDYSSTTYERAKKDALEKIEKKFKDDLPSDTIIYKTILGNYMRLGNLIGDFKINKKKINVKYDNENINEGLKLKWGKKYSEDDYLKLEDFYFKMKDFNKIETPQDESYLKKLAVISLKMDKELEDGNYSQVKQLGDLFSKYMADSKFRAMDLTDASKTGGLRTFSQIYAEVERDDFIPPWEKYRVEKNLNQDIVDKTIMYILNYTLKLNKIPQMVEPPEDTPKIEE